jgi:hypothetical protein
LQSDLDIQALKRHWIDMDMLSKGELLQKQGSEKILEIVERICVKFGV